MVNNNNNNNAPSSDPAPAFNSFPIVKAVDIVSSLSQELNIQVTLDEITKPNFNVASRCFQAFLDYLSGISVKDIEANKNAVQGTMIYKELYEEALPMKIQLAEIKVMMKASMVTDFTLQDLTRPEPKRFRRHLSALINFVRFRADRVIEVDQFEAESNELVDRLNQLVEETEHTKARIEEERSRREEEEPLEKELKAENERLSAGLMELKSVQSKLMEEVESARAEKAVLTKKQTENLQESLRLTQLLQRLDSRVIQSPKKLRTKLTEGTQEVTTLKRELAALELRSRELAKKLVSLDNFEVELKASQTLLDGVKIELGRVSDERSEYEVLLTQVQDTKAALDDAKRRQVQLSDRLSRAQERLDRSKNMLESKRAQHKSEKETIEQAWRTCQENAGQYQAKVEELKGQVNGYNNDIHATEEAYKQSHVQWVQTRDTLVQIGDKYMRDMSRMLNMQTDQSFHQ